MRILRPETRLQAVAMLADAGPGARFSAGSTALQAEWSLGRPRPAALVDIAALDGLSGIVSTEDGLRIGANQSLSTIIASSVVAAGCPLLSVAARRVGAAAIRNRATLGGNIGWRTGCLLPALLSLDASLEVLWSGGTEALSLTDWLAEPDVSGLITAILVPNQDPDGRHVFRKIGLREAFTPSVIAVSGAILAEGDTVTTARLAVGGGPVPPRRLAGIEGDLVGRELAAIEWPTIRNAIEAAIDAPDDLFRSARYRQRAGANALVDALAGTRAHEPRGERTIRPAKAQAPDEIRLSRENGGNRWHARPDLTNKVAARMPYLTDARRDGMLVGAVLRLDEPHARILSIDTSAAEALPGVKTVVTHRDIAGRNAFGIVFQDQPALCSDKVRYAGDPVAGVAAIDRETALRALSLIRVDYEPLPAAGDMLSALEETANPFMRPAISSPPSRSSAAISMPASQARRMSSRIPMSRRARCTASWKPRADMRNRPRTAVWRSSPAASTAPATACSSRASQVFRKTGSASSPARPGVASAARTN